MMTGMIPSTGVGEVLPGYCSARIGEVAGWFGFSGFVSMVELQEASAKRNRLKESERTIVIAKTGGRRRESLKCDRVERK